MHRPIATRLPRRAVLAGAAAIPLFAIRSRPANAAEFDYKFATGQSPDNPINTRMQEAIDRIKSATAGRVAMTLFPANKLGSDVAQIAQLRAGKIHFLNVAGSVLSTVVPATALVNVGFAFGGYDQVWHGVDGDLGRFIAGEIDKTGMHLAAPMGDNGFRQITSTDTPIKGPALKGFHIRVPPSPIFTSLFQSLGATATSIDFNVLYAALKNKQVGGEENGLVTVQTASLFEVQKYCAMTSHIWDSFCVLANGPALDKLPADLQAIVKRELKQGIVDQRADEARLDAGLKGTLQRQGMVFTEVDKPAFQAVLKQSGFYKSWQGKFGAQGWAALQSVSGPLA